MATSKLLSKRLIDLQEILHGRVLAEVWTAPGETGVWNPAMIVAAIVCLGLPFVAFARLILFHFYLRGSFVLDTGLLASLMWRSDWALTLPESVGGGSFFTTHISPLLLILGCISRLLPISMTQFFAGFMGLSHAALAFSVFWLLAVRLHLRHGLGPWTAAGLALGFAFSGLALAIARYPHFETLIAAFFLLFAAARAARKRTLAVVFFTLGLATREDAGLHYAAVLGLLVALNAMLGVKWRRQRLEAIFLSSALFYSTLAFTFQASVMTETSALVRVYLGDPPLAHVTFSLLANRTYYLAVSRPYVVLPALAAGIWALRERNPYIMVGYFACTPWLLLHLLAKSPMAGALVSYYAFPFLIAMAWPLLAVLPQSQTGEVPHTMANPIVGFVSLLVLSFVPSTDLHNPGRLQFPQAFLEMPSPEQQFATDRAVAAISAAQSQLGRLMVDNSVAALDPKGFTNDEIPFELGLGNSFRKNMLLPDTVVFLAGGYDSQELRLIADNAGLDRRYVVHGTALRVETRKPLEDVPGLGEIVSPE